ncbi:MAG: glutaconate CoA-transferase [Clostridiales Family XIII bacterium]|jgi:glutaconate CoA-transferase subunit A|nr:glutaconate CoA-transferase [Clostridiales Family XIII bacterium]
MNKTMTVREAVERFVHDGDSVAIGGFVTNRRPYGLVYEIIRQKRRGLYIEGGPSGGDIDMLIGAGCVAALMVSYIANSGFSMVCNRFRNAVESDGDISGSIMFEDYSLDVQTLALHGAALGLSYIPVKNMIGSDMLAKWGISEEERAKHPKLPPKKYVMAKDPFDPESELCLVPTPRIDVALLHVQQASADGICRIDGSEFQDVDIAVASRHTIVSCEELVDSEQLKAEPERNTITGLCVDAVVHMPRGAHPSQCFGRYDYDSRFFVEYDKASRTKQGFEKFMAEKVFAAGTHSEYLKIWEQNTVQRS